MILVIFNQEYHLNLLFQEQKQREITTMGHLLVYKNRLDLIKMQILLRKIKKQLEINKI